jgi:hypothetical protein
MTRIRTSKSRWITVLSVCLLLSFFLGGCEQIFTYSPFAFLQRPPSALTPEQQIEYGKDALASGIRRK